MVDGRCKGRGGGGRGGSSYKGKNNVDGHM